MINSYDDLARQRKTFDKLDAKFRKLKLPVRHRNELVKMVVRYHRAHYSADGIAEAIKAQLAGRQDWERFWELLLKYLPVIIQLILALL